MISSRYHICTKYAKIRLSFVHFWDAGGHPGEQSLREKSGTLPVLDGGGFLDDTEPSSGKGFCGRPKREGRGREPPIMMAILTPNVVDMTQTKKTLGEERAQWLSPIP
jgi:hypothetical protein